MLKSHFVSHIDSLEFEGAKVMKYSRFCWDCETMFVKPKYTII